MPTDQDLLEQLETKHPDYQEWADEWKLYRDVVGDILVDKQSYLPRNQFELESQYNFRVAVSEFIPESGLAIQSLSGALYDESPKREFPGQESKVAEFLENADRKGNAWGDVVTSLCEHLLGYGTLRTLINVPAIESRRGPVTRADEKSLGIRPYIVNYTPLSVIDWDVDDLDKLIFVRIREERYKKRDGAETWSRAVKHKRIIEYDRDRSRWWVFAEDPKKGVMEKIDQGEALHGLGMVPMVIEQIKEVKPLIGRSFVRYSARADKQKFQKESDLDYDTYIHAHPWLKVWTENEMHDIGIGTNSFIKLDPGGAERQREDAEYIGTPTSAFEALQAGVEAKRTQIYRHANTDPLGILNSDRGIFQASGVARSWSFDTSEARILKRIARKMEQVEHQVFEIVLRLQEIRDFAPDEKVSKAQILYPEEFDLSATDTLIEQTERIGQIVNSPTLLRVLHKRIASSKVGDTSPKVLKQIHEEIEENELIGTPVGQPKNVFRMPAPGEVIQTAEEKEAQNDQPPDDVPEEESPPERPPSRRSRRRRA